MNYQKKSRNGGFVGERHGTSPYRVFLTGNPSLSTFSDLSLTYKNINTSYRLGMGEVKCREREDKTNPILTEGTIKREEGENPKILRKSGRGSERVVMKTCVDCGKPLNTGKKYCSQDCFRNKTFPNRGKRKTCENCGKLLSVKQTQDKQRCCSHKCSLDIRYPIRKIKRYCLHCGKVLEKGIKYCSKECHFDARYPNRHEKQDCVFCGKPLTRKQIIIKNKYCSMECHHKYSVGKNNPNYKGKVDLICEYCGKTKKVLPFNIKYGRQFCSSKCRNKARIGKPILSIRNGELVKCANCGKKKYVSNHFLKRNERFYCNYDCMHQHQKGENNPNYKSKIPITCLNCGKIKMVKPYQLKLSIGTKFCSPQCNGEYHRNEKSPHWRGGISFEPYGIEFNKRLKEFIRERDNNTCQLCETREDGNRLDVHHIDYNKKNNHPSNLISLCHKCHTKTNRKRQYWTSYFQIRMNLTPQQNGYIDLLEFIKNQEVLVCEK